MRYKVHLYLGKPVQEDAICEVNADNEAEAAVRAVQVVVDSISIEEIREVAAEAPLGPYFTRGG